MECWHAETGVTVRLGSMKLNGFWPLLRDGLILIETEDGAVLCDRACVVIRAFGEFVLYCAGNGRIERFGLSRGALRVLGIEWGQVARSGAVAMLIDLDKLERRVCEKYNYPNGYVKALARALAPLWSGVCDATRLAIFEYVV